MDQEPEELKEEEAMVASCVDAERFAEVFERRAREIYRYLSCRTGSDLAEELTAETFARAFAARQRFDPRRGSVRAWLYGIATNVVRNQYRSERRKRSAYAREVGLRAVRPSSEGADNGLAERDQLETALAHLDRRSQDVLYLLVAVGLTYEETATALGIPVGTVRSRYFRAKAQMAELLGAKASRTRNGHPTEERPS